MGFFEIKRTRAPKFRPRFKTCLVAEREPTAEEASYGAHRVFVRRDARFNLYTVLVADNLHDYAQYGAPSYALDENIEAASAWFRARKAKRAHARPLEAPCLQDQMACGYFP